MHNTEIEDALTEAESTFEINLHNKISGTNYPNVKVFKKNTLGQILDEYGKDIGIEKNTKVFFTNKRTQKTTTDTNETVEGFELIAGDVLSMCDDNSVAFSCT